MSFSGCYSKILNILFQGHCVHFLAFIYYLNIDACHLITSDHTFFLELQSFMSFRYLYRLLCRHLKFNKCQSKLMITQSPISPLIFPTYPHVLYLGERYQYLPGCQAKTLGTTSEFFSKAMNFIQESSFSSSISN